MTTLQMKRSGEMQGALWGAAANDWATMMEPQGVSLFEAVLADGRFTTGAAVLDIGCGSGYFAQLIVSRGCRVTGFDASEPLLQIASRRVPTAQFHRGDMQSLPFEDATFDIVTGMNSFQYAAEPKAAFIEARRVLKRGAQLFAATWGLPEKCEAARYLAAIKPLLPSQPSGGSGPFALSDENVLRSLARSAGLTPLGVKDVDVTWHFENLEVALVSMLSAGPSVLAIQTSGVDRVRKALEQAIAPFRLSNGAFRLENSFRYLVASRD